MGHIASTYRVKWGQDKLWDLPLPNQKGPKGIQELIQIRRSIGPPSSQDLYIYYTLYTHTHTHTHTVFPGGSDGKESASSAGDPGTLGQKDPLEKGMAIHSSLLAWRIPWTKEPGGLQPMGSQRVRHDRTHTHTHIYVCVCIHTYIYIYVCVYIYIHFEHRKSHICWRKNDLESYFSNFIITTNHLRSWWVGRPGREPAGQQGLWVSIKLPRASLQLQVWGSRIAQYWFHCRFQWFFFVLTLTSFQRSLILSTKFLLNVYYEAGNSLGG